MSPDRRQFLGWGAAAAAGAALAPGLRLVELALARSPQEAASVLQRWGLLIDITKCADCDACVTACDEENGLGSQANGHGRPETDSHWIRKVSLRDRHTGYAQTLPLMCQHCADPPCVDVCPTGASFKRADGIVLVDKHTCIGCRYCVMACPYGARSFVHEAISGQTADVPRGKGTVESCTLCVHRVDRGETPACVAACNRDGGKAMAFGDLNDASTEIHRRLHTEQSSAIRPDLALDPGVRYQGL
jgi:molybdopterin-containing oxidoreductase family iron-sulfur binding subunit